MSPEKEQERWDSPISTGCVEKKVAPTGKQGRGSAVTHLLLRRDVDVVTEGDGATIGENPNDLITP